MKLTKVIVTAMKEEADIIINRFNLKEEKKLNNLTIFEGERENDGEKENIVLALTGIGKIGAAIGTTYIFENYQVDKLVNI
jgi:adenosylhomocysteine nucleosidase